MKKTSKKSPVKKKVAKKKAIDEVLYLCFLSSW